MQAKMEVLKVCNEIHTRKRTVTSTNVIGVASVARTAKAVSSHTFRIGTTIPSIAGV